MYGSLDKYKTHEPIRPGSRFPLHASARRKQTNTNIDTLAWMTLLCSLGLRCERVKEQAKRPLLLEFKAITQRSVAAGGCKLRMNPAHGPDCDYVGKEAFTCSDQGSSDTCLCFKAKEMNPPLF